MDYDSASGSSSSFLTNLLQDPSSKPPIEPPQAKIKCPEGSQFAIFPISEEKEEKKRKSVMDCGVSATDPDSCFLTNPLPKPSRCDWWLKSNRPIEEPDYVLNWDHNDMANQGPEALEFLRQSAEKAIEFYNTNNPGADFEVVEVLSFNEFFSSSFNLHMNFKAKPKIAADDDRLSVRTFFTEVISFDHPPFDPADQRVGKPFSCSLLEEGSTAAFCNSCHPSNNIIHPLRGYYTGNPAVLYGREPVLFEKWLSFCELE